MVWSYKIRFDTSPIIAGGVGYVYKLRADNAFKKANAIKMEMAYETQQKTIEKQKADFEEILEANRQMNIQERKLKRRLTEFR